MDIACSAELVRLARSLTDLPICVSAVDPQGFVAAVEVPYYRSKPVAFHDRRWMNFPTDFLSCTDSQAGANMVEIGNYDGFYGEGRIFSAEEVLQLTRETRRILGDRIPLSVTIPHTLALADQVRGARFRAAVEVPVSAPLPAQVALALDLEAAGADIIQTEGGAFTLRSPP